MVLLGDEAQMEACFGPLETMLVSVQDRCTVCAKFTIASENYFGRTGWYSKVTRLKWKLISVRLEIVLILTHDR
jgi:hypothetical protein